MFAIYEAGDYAAHGSAFNIGTDRTPLPGGATNLLRQSFDGPVFWIERDDSVNGGGVSTFVINSEVIDLSKAPTPPTSFAAGNYVIEASIFGFGIGSFDLTRPFQLALSSATGATPSQPIPGPITVLPGPLPATATALINYSRTPYQADIFGTQSNFNDESYQRGPLDSSTAFQLASTSLNAAALTRPNQKPLEVLASMGFITSLGTGRLSGDFVTPNTYDPRNVGYEDPVDQSGVRPYPPTVASGGASTPRPLTKLGAIGSSTSFTDLEANPEYLGLTTRLPLGALYRDKDFHGGRFSDQQSSPLIYVDKVGVGSGVAGLAVTETLDQLESPTMPAETSAGVAGDVLVMVDGESVTYSSLVNFRTNRGGSAFIGSGGHPGGEIFATYEKVMGSVSGSRTIVGRAFLVRNALTNVGATQVSAGDELMLAIVTQVMELNTIPSEAMVLLGTNGSGESLSAADLYRIEGHPLIANHTFYDVDPSTINLPVGKTIAQIAAPPDNPLIPLGAASTVYASDGTRNFWTNTPTVIDINVLDAVLLGPQGTSFTAAYLSFTQYALPNITQADAAPGVAGRTLFITAQKGTATSGTLSSFSSGSISIASGEMTSPTLGWNGESGSVTIASGNVDANLTGDTGIVLIVSGTNYGTGDSGTVTVGSSGATTGNSGNVKLVSGSISGTSGSGGDVTVSSGNVSSASNTTGSGGNVVVKAGSTAAVTGTGTGGNITLTAGFGPAANGTVNVKLGSSSIQYGSFNNLDLVLGPTTGTGNYGIQFTSGATNVTIGQADNLVGDGQAMLIKAQNSLQSGDHYGANLQLSPGYGHGSHPDGNVIIANKNGSYSTNATFSVNSLLLGPFFSLAPITDYSILFDAPTTHPTISQVTGSGAGVALTIQAQNAGSGTGGDIRLLGGNGVGASNNGGNIILLPGAPGSGGTTGLVAFDMSVLGPTITQLDQTGSAGQNLTITAQRGGSGWGGGDLNLNGGPGIGGGNGGGVEVSSGTSDTGGSGSIILSTPAGTSTGSIAIRPGGFDGLLVDFAGVHIRQGSGNNQGLFFEAANPAPSIIGSGVLYVNPQGDVKANTSARGLSTLNGTIARIVDTQTLNGPVTSASPVSIISINPSFTGVVDGDIIEGVCSIQLTANPSAFSGVGTLYLTIQDGVTLDSYQHAFNLETTVGLNRTITIPFSFTAGVGTTGTVVIKPTLSSDGTTSIGAFSPNVSGKWLFAKHIRP